MNYWIRGKELDPLALELVSGALFEWAQGKAVPEEKPANTKKRSSTSPLESDKQPKVEVDDLSKCCSVCVFSETRLFP
jgi:hypothetical protein